MNARTIRVSEDAYAKVREWKLPIERDETQAILRMAVAAEKSVNGGRHTPSARAGGDLVTQGGRVPNGTQLQATYKSREYEAEVRDGAVEWNGDRFKSLTAAAVAVIRSTGSNRATENGWRFWEYRDAATDEWKTCKDLQSS